MIRLSKEQLSMLKRCMKAELDCTKLSSKELEIITFLENNQLISTYRKPVIQILNGQPNPYKGSLLSAKISEYGKSYIVEKTIDEKRYKHPFIVSIIAILISALALLLSALSLYMQLYS